MPTVDGCRICNSTELHTFLKLGPTPLANSPVKPENATLAQSAYPLNVCLCRNCGLVQLDYVVPPEILFKNYIYFSSTSDTMRKHFAELAHEALEKFSRPNDLIVEVASNDGVLLKNLIGKGVRILGVEPAANIAAVATKSGVETVCDFFSLDSAARILASKGPAAVIIANNVFAHVAELHDFVKGMKTLLSRNGVAMIEFPYLLDLYKNKEFDTIYHEHLAYFSLKPVIYLFDKFEMEVFEVKKTAVHGGSIRIYVQHRGGPYPKNEKTLQEFLELEENTGLYEPETYDLFARDVQALRINLLSLLTNLKKDGKKIAGYGAPAKGNTLLNYFRIGTDLLDYIVDKSPYKQGLLTPGMQIPVYGPEHLEKDPPDYLLILAWNFFDEIMAQQAAFRKNGGRFIIPLPQPKII